MAKDRNTFAKRQREVEKKRKANEKRERRKSRNKTAEPPNGTSAPALGLSSEEEAVLGVFRKYLMTPGRMLCFGKPDLDSYRVPLAKLIEKGLLVAEKFQGGYSLTQSGYAAMQHRE